MMISTLLFIFFIIGFVIHVYKKWKAATFLARNFPMPPAFPLIGHIADFPKDPHAKFVVLESFFKYGKNLLIMKAFYDTVLFISDPNDVETLLTKSVSESTIKSDDFEILEPWLGKGISRLYSDKWLKRRKFITPDFHLSFFDNIVEIFHKKSDIFIGNLKSKVGENDFNLYSPISLFALDVIYETAMGIPLNAQLSPDSDYVLAFEELSSLLQSQYYSSLKKFSFLYEISENGRRKAELIRILHEHTIDVISKNRDYFHMHPDNFFANRKNHFMDIILHAGMKGNGLTIQDIQQEVDTFIFEGYNKITAGISFALYQLSLNQDVQEKLYEELCQAFPNEKSPKITIESVKNLTYLDMVIKECLRINPPVAYMGRKLMDPHIIGGVRVPPHTNINIAIYNMHHNPELFPDPEKFDPTRFDLNNKDERHPFAYIPFSGGPRNCIGEKFALLAIKLAIAKSVMNFKILPPLLRKIILRLQSDFVLRSQNGLFIRIENRERNI